MKFLLKNSNWSLTLCLNLLKIFGFLVPGKYNKIQKVFLRIYGIFWFISVNGIYTVVQAGDLIQIWGDLPLMVSTSFLLFTNVAFGMKIINVLVRAHAVQAIIDDGEHELTEEDRKEGIQIIKSCNRETSWHLYLYFFLSGVTVLGWGASAEKNSLPLRAWYPYDTSKSPAFELTYFHQITALLFGASLNISMDTLATSLMAVCRCRLKLVNLCFRNLCIGLTEIKKHELYSLQQEATIMSRLKSSVRRHHAVLKTAKEIQRCFNEPILAQFAVSMVIICVTAYQLAVELHETPKNWVRIVAMTAYLICMILQVFLYCYHGNELSEESGSISWAAYACPWFSCSTRVRRALLVVQVRARRPARLVAGGLTALSLASFMAIVKASYTFFTVLQRVEDRQK